VADGADVPQRFGFGSQATPERIALWDRDVAPDGVGLPPGRGTVAEGQRVYMTWCVSCHGPTATEGPNDVLAGGGPWDGADPPRPRTVGNYWPYATTLFDYIVRAMPQNAPGSLSADDTYAVIAWLLALNGIIPQDAALDAASLPGVVMPARDRFVPDDRTGGPQVR
jgi:cytochrome c